MSKQIRMACAVMDLLAEKPAVKVSDAVERVRYDEGSVRQALKVLCELGYAEARGLDGDMRSRLYVAGPKLRADR